MVDKIKHLYGVRPFLRHSLVLLVAGFVYALIGIAFILDDPTPGRRLALQYAIEVMEYNGWGYVFIAVGFLAMFSSRWPPISETWGYTVLTGMSVLWAGFYGASAIFGDAPPAGIPASLLWGLMGFLWWAISGLNNPQANLTLLDEVRILQRENLELHAEVIRLNLKE